MIVLASNSPRRKELMRFICSSFEIEPAEIDGRVYCRGAQDDKGQSFAFLCGLRDCIERGIAVPTVKV